MIHGFRLMLPEFLRLRIICCRDTTLMLQQPLQCHYVQQCLCKRQRPKQCLSKSPALHGLSLPFPGQLGAVADCFCVCKARAMGSIPPWTASGSWFVICELCGFWYLVGVTGSECLMQSSEQSLFTDHMNACTLFPFKLTLSGCQHGV